MTIRIPSLWSDLDVALCHDWLTGMRGGERVLEILCESFPRAPIHTLIHNRASVSDLINRHPIHPSWLQEIPGIHTGYRNFLPLFPWAVRALRVPQADLVISLSHCVAKGIRPPPGTPHLCYCFTPMRYAWLFHDEYVGRNPLKRLAVRPLLAWLRRWDRVTAPRVTRFVAISRHVQDRILRFYGRESDIVYPPVDLDRWTPDFRPPSNFDLVVSALVPYKRVDLAVQAYSQSGYPLRIVGTGGELPRLQAMAAPNIQFLGRQPDSALLELYRSCRQLVFPGEEDFGIVPLEAQACGRPVVAFGRGGATETVVQNASGLFFGEQTVQALREAIESCAARTWDSRAIRAQSEAFGVQNFIDGMNAAIAGVLGRGPLP